jgi:hypothetical protein
MGGGQGENKIPKKNAEIKGKENWEGVGRK